MTKLKTTKNIKEWNISAGYAQKSETCVKRKKKTETPTELKLAFWPES